MAARLAQDLGAALGSKDALAACDVLLELEEAYLREGEERYAAVVAPLQVRG